MKRLLFTLVFLAGFAVIAQSQTQSQPSSQPPAARPSQQAPMGHPMEGGKRPPPPEALKACESKNSGDACSFEGREKQKVEGACWTPDSSKPLACKPSNAPAEQKK